MTYEEAIIKTAEDIADSKSKYSDELMEYYDLTLKALEKQIPKKPTEDGVDRLCPICECYVGCIDAMCNIKHMYCRDCGQKLKWGNDND